MKRFIYFGVLLFILVFTITKVESQTYSTTIPVVNQQGQAIATATMVNGNLIISSTDERYALDQITISNVRGALPSVIHLGEYTHKAQPGDLVTVPVTIQAYWMGDY